MTRFSSRSCKACTSPTVRPINSIVLPVEILGTVYERFLGKVIRLTAGHQAKVEEKPEVRKAGGVYYTPAYIVDYIVKHTVGRQIEGRSPMQLAGLRNGKQPLPRSGHGLRQRVVPVGRIPVPSRPLPELVHRAQARKNTRRPSIKDRRDGALAADDRRKEAHLDDAYLRRGYRRPGRGSDQAVVAVEGVGGRNRPERQPATAALSTTGRCRTCPTTSSAAIR